MKGRNVAGKRGGRYMQDLSRGEVNKGERENKEKQKKCSSFAGTLDSTKIAERGKHSNEEFQTKGELNPAKT